MPFLIEDFRQALERTRATWLPAGLFGAFVTTAALYLLRGQERVALTWGASFFLMFPVLVLGATLSFGFEMTRRRTFSRPERGAARALHTLLWLPTAVILLIGIFGALTGGGFGIHADRAEVLGVLGVMLVPQLFGIPIVSWIILRRRGTWTDRKWFLAALLITLFLVLVADNVGEVVSGGGALLIPALPMAAGLGLVFYRILRPVLVPQPSLPTDGPLTTGPTYERAKL